MNLAELPSDLIRMILTCGNETVDSQTRLITPRWHSLALEHTSNRKNLPILNYFLLKRYFIGDPTIHMTIKHHHRYHSYFGAVGRKNDFKEYTHVNLSSRFVDKNQVRWDRVTRLFDRCSRIKKLELHMNESKELKGMNKALNGVIVDELIFRSGNDLKTDEPAIREVIGTNKVTRLVFVIQRFRGMSAHEFDNIVAMFGRLLDHYPTIQFVLGDTFTRSKEWGTMLRRATCQYMKVLLNTVVNNAGLITADVFEETLKNGEVAVGVVVMKKKM